MSRRRLVDAVRERMRAQNEAREAEAATAAAPPPPPPPPVAPPSRPPDMRRDSELERLEAEARYHRDRFDLYQARVISGSKTVTSPSRLRELKRTATAAAERLAQARRARRRGSA